MPWVGVYVILPHMKLREWNITNTFTVEDYNTRSFALVAEILLATFNIVPRHSLHKHTLYVNS
jgi:hypothetical protein